MWWYANEVGKELEFNLDPALVPGKQLDLAVKLIEARAAKFEPEKFHRGQVEALIAAKVRGGEVASHQPQPEGARPSRTSWKR
jgi:non-homologous end joining protein Ku